MNDKYDPNDDWFGSTNEKPNKDNDFFEVSKMNDVFDGFDSTEELPKQHKIDLDFSNTKPVIPLNPNVPIHDDDYIPTQNRRRKSKGWHFRRKPVIILLLFIVAILFIISLFVNQDKSYKAPNTQTPVAEGNAPAADKKAPVNTGKNPSDKTDVRQEPDAFSAHQIDKTQWNLLLVNTSHLLSADFTPKTASIDGEESVDERVLESYLAMQAAGADEGFGFYACSGYRPYSLQERLFNSQIETVLATQNCTREEAAKIAGTVVAVPGTSEHQTGLAIDIVTSNYTSLDEGIKDTPEMQWLYKNAARFGFILRFPKDKSEVTGIIYEPWHFRYVGVEAATEITNKNITLEEYLGEN